MTTTESSPTDQPVDEAPRTPRESYERQRTVLAEMQVRHGENAVAAFARADRAARHRNRSGSIAAVATAAVIGIGFGFNGNTGFEAALVAAAAAASFSVDTAGAEADRRREIRTGDRLVALGDAAAARTVLNAVQIGDCIGLPDETMTVLHHQARPLLLEGSQLFAVDMMAGAYAAPGPETPAS